MEITQRQVLFYLQKVLLPETIGDITMELPVTILSAMGILRLYQSFLLEAPMERFIKLWALTDQWLKMKARREFLKRLSILQGAALPLNMKAMKCQSLTMRNSRFGKHILFIVIRYKAPLRFLRSSTRSPLPLKP